MLPSRARGVKRSETERALLGRKSGNVLEPSHLAGSDR
jgi:hypothetical protein